VIRASRAAYLVCGVLTALALAGWGVRAAGTPHSNTANNTAVPLNPPAQATPSAQPANNGGQNNGGNTDQNNANGGAGGAAPAGDVTAKLVAKRIAKMGVVVDDDKGFALYRFDKDTPNPPASNCQTAQCTAVWPPVLTSNGSVPEVEGVDQALVGTIQRNDGGVQLTIAGWPIYRYLGDKIPGGWPKGQGVNGTWWVISPNGKRNLTCVPTATPTAVAPPANTNDGGNNNGGSNNGGGSGTY
jgi:predicted lipoprotein with Yx(FWY)xxD motif